MCFRGDLDLPLDELAAPRGPARLSRRVDRSEPYSTTNSRDALISSVKDAQRSSLQWVEAWRAMCDESGTGNYDPARYDEVFLQRALVELGTPTKRSNAGEFGTTTGAEIVLKKFSGGEGTLGSARSWQGGGCQTWQQNSSSERRQWGNSAAWRQGSSSADWRQSGSAAWRQQSSPPDWGQGDWGQQDWRRGSSLEWGAPASNGLLKKALGQINPVRLTAPSYEALVEEVKTWQRTGGPTHADAWRSYCDERGDGSYDPKRYDAAFLRRALMDLCGSNHAEEGLEQGGEPSHASLVEQVKGWQRTSMSNTAAWRGYCDEHGDRSYDPVRYDVTFLRRALASLCGIGGVSLREGSEVNHSALVEEVKSWQRASKWNTTQWRQHCDESGDGTYDPSRYDAAFLTDALQRLAQG